MPGQLIKLSPEVTPQSYFDKNKEQLGIVPDGTGLQILFKVNGEFYLMAGPRTDKILSVNGGAIENKQAPFASQLSEELEEETFGVMNLVPTEKGYQLLLNDGSSHALAMQNDHTYLMYKPGKYAYVTFTAICDTLTLDQLNALAANLSPTANFWNKIGNYLFTHTKNAPKDATFADYWQSQFEDRSAFIAKLVAEYHQISDAGIVLLINPTDVFQVKNIEDALNQLHQITDYAALMKMARHTVGRYSERSGYYVFHASELVKGAPADSDRSVKDIHGNVVATGGIFNDEAVAIIPKLIFVEKQAVASVATFSLFSAASIQTTLATEAPQAQNTNNY